QAFGLTAYESEYLDPRLRLLMMSAWHTLEDACYTPKQLSQKNVDVYIAAEGSAYAALFPHDAPSAYAQVNATSWSLANRVSHAFGFTGKSVAIDTACSGSCVALHEAIQALRSGRADYAVVGSANLLFGWGLSMAYLGQQALGILAESTTCHSFQK